MQRDGAFDPGKGTAMSGCLGMARVSKESTTERSVYSSGMGVSPQNGQAEA